MAAQEERSFRTLSKRCSINESRNRLFKALISRKIGLKELEETVLHEESKFKGGGKYCYSIKHKIVMLHMTEKVKDNIKEGISLRKRRASARKI